MMEWIKLKLNLKVDSSSDSGYKNCISDLIQNEIVHSMKDFVQHINVTCLELVSYNSYLICKRLGLNCYLAARGGLLHNFFLYDWHIAKPYKGLHRFIHPYVALENANKHFNLNDLEKDIIKKHMWPLTLRLPRYKEAFIVAFVDKYCTSKEIIKFGSRKNVYRLKEIFEL